jgi:hypothetical protein
MADCARKALSIGHFQCLDLLVTCRPHDTRTWSDTVNVSASVADRSFLAASRGDRASINPPREEHVRVTSKMST